MYSYLHRYHAGNFADVHKHIVLVAILNKLREKSAPFAVLDAFAGEGLYSLNSEAALKNAEHMNGIEKVWSQSSLPLLAQAYRDVVAGFQPNRDLSVYPGSPAFIAALLRPQQDKAFLIEGHPNCFSILKQHFNSNNQIHLHQRDAYEALTALLPFKEKRGLVFLDPSYEVKQEYEQLANKILAIYPRFANGIYCIWYPILKEKHHERLKAIFKQRLDIKQYHHEFFPTHCPTEGLLGSGLWIINPPWQLDKQVDDVFKPQPAEFC